MMNRLAAVALTWSSVFLTVMAVLVGSSALFYMSTAIIATILAARLQAYLAVRGLRFERFTSPAVKVGEKITVEIVVWSEKRIKRPLVTVIDSVPIRLVGKDPVYSLPVAPSYDQPIKTRYSFQPLRRGRYKWRDLTVSATDALGLVTVKKVYETTPIELTVYPSPLPVNEDVNAMMGWGASELDEGRHRGSGLDPHGIREYANGDPLRYIHWRSTARRGKLMVKEFETGSGVVVHFLLQRTQDTEVASGELSTFEAMCGNALFLASDLVKKGATVVFPVHEAVEGARSHPEVREREIREVLTDIQPDSMSLLSNDVATIRQKVSAGHTVVLFCAVQDSLLPAAIAGWTDVQVTVFVYDPAEYGPLRPNLLPASAPNYIGALESAGASVKVLPRMVHLA